MNHEPRPSTSRNTCIEIIALKLLQFPYLITLEKEDREISWSKRQYYIMHNSSSLGNRRGSFYLKVGRGGEQAKRERATSRCPQDFLRRPKRHRSLQPRSKGSLPPVYGAREMDRRENLRTRLEKVIFYIKRGQFILRFFLNKQMKCGVLSN